MIDVLADHDFLISRTYFPMYLLGGVGTPVSFQDAEKKITVEIILRLKVDEAVKHTSKLGGGTVTVTAGYEIVR